MRDSATRIAATIGRPRGIRRAAAMRLESALPDLPAAARRRLLSRFFSHRARAAAEQRNLGRLDPAQLCSRLDLEGWERIEETEKAGAGVVLVSASLGLFDLLPTVLELYKGGLDERRHLARLDLQAPGQAVEMPFLGRSFRAPCQAAETALDQGCAALPIFAYLEPRRRFKVVVRAPIAPTAEGRDRDRLTRLLVAAIEAEILSRPEQYDWLAPKAVRS